MRIIGAMFSQIISYLVVEGSITIFFATLAQIWFGQLKQFRTISASLETIIYASFDYYDTSTLDDLGEQRIYAILFYMTYLVLNILLLKNYVIAIMTDRYGEL
jgi:hypothetical protein